MRILIVEDDRNICRVLHRSLAGYGHEVKSASTAAEAGAVLENDPFDLLVVDINLPDDTGWSIIERLNSGPNQAAKVVVMSAVRPSSSRIRQFCPFSILLKPFPIDALHRLTELASGEFKENDDEFES